VINAWQKFNIIRIAISFTPKPFIWEQIIWGILEPQYFSKIVVILLFSILKLLGNCFEWEFYGGFGVKVVSMTLG
jgi:hypothetical protein